MLMKISPQDSSAYVLLGNIYATKKQFGQKSDVLQAMTSAGAKKVPGTTTIEVNGAIHQFYVEDTSHPDTEKIYSKLHELDAKLKQAAHKPDIDAVSRDQEAGEQAKSLCYHR